MKTKIVEELEALRRHEAANKQPFKARAYAKAIANLKAHPGPVADIADVKDIPGIGAGIQDRIREILASGFCAEVAQLRLEAPVPGAVEELSQVYGIGPSKIKALRGMGIRTVAELRAAVERTPAILHEKQRAGLRYVEDLVQRIPRAEMLRHEAYIKDTVRRVSPEVHAEVVGSFRRGAESSGDVDVLLRVPVDMPEAEGVRVFGEIVAEMRAAGYVEEVLAKGDKKCMGIARLDAGVPARRVDLLWTPAAEYPYALLYFTGSDTFNVAFRKHAMELGYTLNEHRMQAAAKGASAAALAAVPAMSGEADIFRFLGLRYEAPEARVCEKSLSKM